MLKSFFALISMLGIVQLAVAQAVISPAAKDSLPVVSSTPSDSAQTNLTGADAAAKQMGSTKQQPLKLFNDPKLIAQEYVFGGMGSYVLGGLGFFIGKGFESVFYTNPKKGTLEFSGVRYDNFHGAFYGAATGMALGTAMTVYFIGQSDEEEGGFWLTTLGSLAGTAAGMFLATQLDVNKDVHWLPFLPLVALPPVGAVLGFNTSRYFSDKKRRAITGHAQAPHFEAPTLSLASTTNGSMLYTLNVLNFKF